MGVKASRLIAILLLLQTHGRMTSADLAERLEVSRRTILRDVEALSAAGVPVYTERGRRGAIVLMQGARLNAARLDPDEVEVLLLAGLDQRSFALLNLEAEARSSARKLATRGLPAPEQARLADLIVVDNTPWASDEAPVDVAAVLAAVRTGQRLQIRYRGSGQAEPTSLVIDPFGLASKGGPWYLVADVDTAPRLLALSRLLEHEVLDEPARRRAGETLSSVWGDLRRHTEPGGRILVTAHLRADRIDLARRILGTRLVQASDTQDVGHGLVVEIVVRYDHPEAVRQLLQFGDHIEVIAPASARRRMHELAADLVRVHACAPSIDVAGS